MNAPGLSQLFIANTCGTEHKRTDNLEFSLLDKYLNYFVLVLSRHARLVTPAKP